MPYTLSKTSRSSNRALIKDATYSPINNSKLVAVGKGKTKQENMISYKKGKKAVVKVHKYNILKAEKSTCRKLGHK